MCGDYTHILVCLAKAWERFVCPSRARLRKFWDAVGNSPQLVGHPIKSKPNWRERAIPFTFHGDGVPTTGVGKPWAKSMTMYSISSMVGLGTTIELMWLIWAVFKLALSIGFLRARAVQILLQLRVQAQRYLESKVFESKVFWGLYLVARALKRTVRICILTNDIYIEREREGERFIP